MISTLISLYYSFFKVGLFTIGGGYAMIPLMEAEVIHGNSWLTAPEFIDIIAIAEMTPGPISINAATFIGYQLAGITGSIIATLGIISPSLILLLLFAKLLGRVIQNPRAENFLNGLRSALVALILLAAYNLGHTAVIDTPTTIFASLILVASLLIQANPLIFITLGAILGLFFYSY